MSFRTNPKVHIINYFIIFIECLREAREACVLYVGTGYLKLFLLGLNGNVEN